MNIYVNEQKLEAELTGERNLKEVYESFRDWISEHKKYILGVSVDRKETPVTSSSLDTMEPENVGRLDFYIGDEMDMLLHTLGEMDHYVDQIGTTLFDQENLSAEDISHLQEGIQWIQQIMTSFSSMLKIDLKNMSVLLPENSDSDPIAEILERLKDYSQNFHNGSVRKDIEVFLGDLRSFKFFLMKLDLQLKSMGIDGSELISTVEKFESGMNPLIDKIISVNEKFQRGKDKEALQDLDGIAAELHACVAVLHAVEQRLLRDQGHSIQELSVGNLSFPKLMKDLAALLKDFNDALETNDFVAVGDIMEYELTEKLASLRPFLTEMKQLLLAKEDVKKPAVVGAS